MTGLTGAGSQVFLPRLPLEFILALRRAGQRPTRFVLGVSVARQQLALFERASRAAGGSGVPSYRLRRRCLVSTSAFGIGQEQHSNCTPLGLHRIARKIGSGAPIGTVFEGRKPIGLTWQGRGGARIVHRILWLEGLEPGLNRGGTVDSFRRYIYIHGFGDEKTLGRPQSCGCIHLGAEDLIQLFDLLPVGTLVWIAAR